MVTQWQVVCIGPAARTLSVAIQQVAWSYFRSSYRSSRAAVQLQLDALDCQVARCVRVCILYFRSSAIVRCRNRDRHWSEAGVLVLYKRCYRLVSNDRLRIVVYDDVLREHPRKLITAVCTLCVCGVIPRK